MVFNITFSFSLKKLYLQDNPIKEIKGLNNLTSLKVLNLSECNITAIEGLSDLYS